MRVMTENGLYVIYARRRLDSVMPHRVDMEKVHNALRRGGAHFLLPV